MKRIAFILVCVALAACMAACGSDLSKESDAQLNLNPQEAAGRQIYEQRCAACHYAYSSRSLHGPGLARLYEKKYLPSGLPANDRFVEQTIINGRGMMPAEGLDFTPEQLNDLIAYLHTL